MQKKHLTRQQKRILRSIDVYARKKVQAADAEWWTYERLVAQRQFFRDEDSLGRSLATAYEILSRGAHPDGPGTLPGEDTPAPPADSQH